MTIEIRDERVIDDDHEVVTLQVPLAIADLWRAKWESADDGKKSDQPFDEWLINILNSKLVFLSVEDCDRVASNLANARTSRGNAKRSTKRAKGEK